MRTYALAIAAAALFAFPASAFSQVIQVPGIEIRPGGVGIGDDDDLREGASRGMRACRTRPPRMRGSENQMRGRDYEGVDGAARYPHVLAGFGGQLLARDGKLDRAGAH